MLLSSENQISCTITAQFNGINKIYQSCVIDELSLVKKYEYFLKLLNCVRLKCQTQTRHQLAVSLHTKLGIKPLLGWIPLKWMDPSRQLKNEKLSQIFDLCNHRKLK